MLQKELEKMGFEEKEAKLYLALLELGEASVQDMARKSGLKRTTVYHILDSLKNRGFLSLAQKGKKTVYIAKDPRSIGEEIKEKEAIFRKNLPELLSITNFLEKKPTIRYFEGLSGIKEVYLDELQYADREILTWWSKSYEIFGAEFFLDFYMPERKKRKIWSRAIAPEGDYGREYQKHDKEQFRKIKLMPVSQDSMELEVSLYGKTKISIKSFQEKFGLIIESKALFNTMKGIFEMQWQTLPDDNQVKATGGEIQKTQAATEEDLYY